MAAVKIGASRQVAIPKKIHDELYLRAGDYLELRAGPGCNPSCIRPSGSSPAGKSPSPFLGGREI